MDKHMFLQEREREFATTLRVLQSMPEDKAHTKPGEKSKTARELAWVFVVEEHLLQALMENRLPSFSQHPPETIGEIIAEYERLHKETSAMIRNMTDEDLKKTAQFYVAPKKLGDVPKINLCWMLLFDSIHHRGQFSVYLRVAGAKVPSIYGPSADEQWI
jgi:uncharacterized damage-inducible protein DinB